MTLTLLVKSYQVQMYYEIQIEKKELLYILLLYFLMILMFFYIKLITHHYPLRHLKPEIDIHFLKNFECHSANGYQLN